MTLARRRTVVALALVLGLFSHAAYGQKVEYQTGSDGVRYQVTRQEVQRQVPVTVMRDQQQTVYTQQITTNNLSHQQVYCVPVTQYQLRSDLRGRWNPFVTPYWTYRMQPVTTWHQQVANVQVPVSSVAWVPQTKTVQVPVTEWRMATEETTTRVAVDQPRKFAGAQPLNGDRSVSIAARSGTGTTLGGTKMESDPPRSGWQPPSGSRYR